MATINWAIALNPSLAVFTLATPYPGTEFWKQCIKQGWIKEGAYSKYDLFHPIIETTKLSLEELSDLLRYAYKRFYIRIRKLAGEYIRELALSREYGLKTYLKNAMIAFRGLSYFRKL